MEDLTECVHTGTERPRNFGRAYAPSGYLLVIILLLLALVATRAQIFAPEPVQWQDLVKTGASYPGSQGSTLTRTGAASGNFDADAISTKWIYGDGWVEFKFGQTDKGLAVGLVGANPNRDWTGFGFTIKSAANGTFAFFEAGTQVGPSPSTFSTSDVFRIERVGTRVTFSRKSSTGTLLTSYTSATPRHDILFVDTSFVQLNGYISNCRYFGASSAEDVLWINHANTVATYDDGSAGSSISKNLATSAYDSDAVSSKAMVADGALRFRVGQTNKVLAIGLSTANPDRNYTSLNYGFHANGAAISVVESGTLRLSTTYGINDVFTIRRTGSTITYSKINAGTETILWTTNGASTSPLIVDCSLNSNGALFTNCQIEGYPLSEAPAFQASGCQMVYAPSGAVLTSASASAGALTASLIPGDGNFSHSNSGALSFSLGDSTQKTIVAGLTISRTPIVPTTTSITYGIKASNGSAEIVVGGVSQVALGGYALTDQFQVRRVGGLIEFLKNGILQRTFAAPSGSLSGAFAFAGSGGNVSSIQWYNGETDLLWRKMVQSTTDWSQTLGGTLTRGGAAAAWTGDAMGTRQLVGDGYIQWKFTSTTKDAMVGLSPSDKNNSYTDLQYAIYANGLNNLVKTFENGVSTGSHGSLSTDISSTFRIRRTGTTIRYSKIDVNGVETFLGGASSISATTPLIVDCSLQDPSVQITNCRISFGDQDGDRLDDQWEYGEFGNLSQTGTGVLGDFDGDGIDNLHEFYDGTDAAETYYSSPPTLTLISGNNQFSDPDTFLGQPLVVEVRDPSQAGNPAMPNVPVRFFVLSGQGFLSTEYGGTLLQASVGAITDATGRAKVYYKQPNLNGVDSVIRAQAGGSSTASNAIDFTCHTNLLVGWWKFDEASGNALDSSPSSPKNDGVISGAVRELSFKDFGSLQSDRAMRFDGLDDYLTVQNQASLNFSAATFSVSAWVKLDSGTDLSSDVTVYPIASKWTSTNGGFEFAIRGGTAAKGLTFRTVNNGTVLQEIAPTVDQRAKLRDGYPHVITFTRDASNVGRLYVDGGEVASLANMAGSLTTPATLFLGKNADSVVKYYKGVLEDVKILATTFRADEIAAAFDSDGDGIPDWWEAKYFGDLDGTNDPDTDTDGDGVSDGDEYEQGRNPNAAAVTNNNLELIIFTPTHN